MERNRKTVIGSKCKVCGFPFLNVQLANGTLIPEHSMGRLNINCPGSNELGDDIYSSPIHRIRGPKLTRG